MSPPSIDIKTLLMNASALGLSYELNLFVSKEPTTPDDCVTIYDTPGGVPDLTMDNVEYNRPSTQVRVRATDYTTGWTLIHDIKRALHGKGPMRVGDTLYTVILCTGEPFMLGRDERNRVIFVANFNMQRR